MYFLKFPPHIVNFLHVKLRQPFYYFDTLMPHGLFNDKHNTTIYSFANMQQTNILDAALLWTHLVGLVRTPSGPPVGAHTADATL